jgi:hypothetical protein
VGDGEGAGAADPSSAGSDGSALGSTVGEGVVLGVASALAVGDTDGCASGPPSEAATATAVTIPPTTTTPPTMLHVMMEALFM